MTSCTISYWLSSAIPAAHVQRRYRRVNVHGLEVLVQHLREEGMLASRFEAYDDDLEQCFIKLVGHREWVNCAHANSSNHHSPSQLRSAE